MSLIKSASKNIDNLVIPAIVIVAAILIYSNARKTNTGDIAADIPPRDREWLQQQVIAKSEPVVLKFGATWCGPCRALDGVIDQYAQQAGGVEVLKVDVDSSPELASDFKVSSIPRVIMFKNGKAVADFTGSRSLESFDDWIESNR